MMWQRMVVNQVSNRDRVFNIEPVIDRHNSRNSDGHTLIATTQVPLYLVQRNGWHVLPVGQVRRKRK